MTGSARAGQAPGAAGAAGTPGSAGTAAVTGIAAAAPPLRLLSAGAAQGLVQALQPGFERAPGGAPLLGRFGAVGAMKEALLAGEPADVFISTHKMVLELAAEGRLVPGSEVPLGRVATGVALRAADVPASTDGTGAVGGAAHIVSSPAALGAALAAASAIYFPDPERATAGIHFAKVLAELGLAERTRARWRTFPNGATAMRELATAGPAGAIGCTQVSEILITPGVVLAGPLPRRFELSTLYTAAITASAAQTTAAARWLAWLGAGAHAAQRRQSGFDPP
jgi:molybdate transport system substrate-binding protein